MFSSILKQAAAHTLLGAVLLGGSMTFAAARAGAQTAAARQFVLSRGAQQVLSNILTNATPYGRQLVWNALLKIGPERAELQLNQLSGVSPYDMQARLQIIASILQMLPAQYHQAFVNGLFQASPEEEQMAVQILRTVVRMNYENSIVAAGAQAEVHREGLVWTCVLGGNYYCGYPLYH